MKAALYAGLVWLLAALTVLSILASYGSRPNLLQERTRSRSVDWRKKLKMDEEKLESLSFQQLSIPKSAKPNLYRKFHQKLHQFLSEETRRFIRSQQRYMHALRQLEVAPQMILAANTSSASSNSSNSQEVRDSQAIKKACYPPKALVSGRPKPMQQVGCFMTIDQENA
eukprot:765019-Hanusia_phi.AAC.4